MSNSEWDYSIHNGPSTWGEKFPMAAGSRQSPVNIVTNLVACDHEALINKPLTWKYEPTSSKVLANPGYCWKIDCDGEGSSLTGGPLKDDVYKLEQYHCHWGCSDSKGSEHTVDGQAFAGELHLVHWNASKYSSFEEAAHAADGLAVLGVFLKVGEEHEEMNKIVRLLSNVIHKDESVEIIDPIDPNKLLPVRGGRAGIQRCINPCMRWADRIIRLDNNKLDYKDNNGYWTYLGSLTTPPCSESVTWILFKKYIQVSHEQLVIFRSLRNFPRGAECPCHDNHGVVVNNFRPPQPVSGRILRDCGSF
ncbi:carbonic anhydrase 13 isoform X2 [Leptopilina heterotoma]|uniref:carbonic anhydrase 13 isoform X2 n=1 Tax=Leptopilina heterotoma TaxID=63436 RepID=UPI001CA9B001|nr:carbonic anhydrase 13 isoform X2 [Leptopilina heterotoma]